MGLTQRQVDTTAIEAMLRTMLLQLDSIKEVLVSQWIDFFNVSSVHALDGAGNKTCFGPSGRRPLGPKHAACSGQELRCLWIRSAIVAIAHMESIQLMRSNCNDKQINILLARALLEHGLASDSSQAEYDNKPTHNLSQFGRCDSLLSHGQTFGLLHTPFVPFRLHSGCTCHKQ